MTLISNLLLDDMKSLQSNISQRTRECDCLEAAAQLYTSLIYDQWKDSIVLVRFFATIPFVELPAMNKVFVKKLTESANISDQLKDSTLVLSLLGSSGAKPEWNDRHDS
ncbi:MAG: hypothetical protein ABIK28_06415, partial [Planctomycetota bacterium]